MPRRGSRKQLNIPVSVNEPTVIRKKRVKRKKKCTTLSKLAPALGLTPEDIASYALLELPKRASRDSMKYFGEPATEVQVKRNQKRDKEMNHRRDPDSSNTHFDNYVERVDRNQDQTQHNSDESDVDCGGGDCECKKCSEKSKHGIGVGKKLRYNGLIPTKVPTLGDFEVTPWMNDHIFPKHPYRALVTGHSGSGKSNLLVWWLLHDAEKGFFEETYLLGHSCKTDPGFNRLVDAGVIKKLNIFSFFDFFN